jgi:hypothetical protein
MRHTCILIALLLTSILGLAQSLAELESINQSWGKFQRAFSELDAELMAEIHRKDLIRI